MSTKIHHLSPIPGTRELYTILDVISNLDEYTKALKELEQKRKEINEIIDLVGDAEEIKKLHAQAKAEHERAEQHAGQRVREANKEYAEAHERTEKMIAEAIEKSNQIKNDSKVREDELSRRVDEFNKLSSDKLNDLNRRLEETTRKELELREREEVSNSMMKEGTKLKKLYEEKIEKIRKLQGEL
jgi:hypothetical protein